MRHIGFLAILGLSCECFPVSAQGLGVPKEIHDAVKALKHPDAKIRAKAAWTLGDQGKDAVPLLDELIAAFADPKLGVRASLADAFGQMGPNAMKAVPALLSGLKDHDPHVRRRVVCALGLIKSEPEIVVPALIATLKDPDKGNDLGIVYVPQAAVIALGNYGAAAKPAVPVLLRILNDEKIDWRFLVLRPVARIQDPEAIPHLLKYMDDKTDIYLRGKVIGALAEFGPKAKDGIPQMIAILRAKGDDEKTRSTKQRAASALGKMGSEATPETIKALMEVMKDEKLETFLREVAARSLVELGPKVAKDAIPAMIDVLHEKRNTFARSAARQSLIAMGKEAVPQLIPYAARFKGEKQNDLRVRLEVVQIFEKLGPAAKDAIGVLTGIVAENDRQISPLAQRALDSVSGKREPEKK